MAGATFKNRLEVFKYVAGLGFSISQAGLYKHHAQGKLAGGRRRGPFSEEEVREYCDFLRESGFFAGSAEEAPPEGSSFGRKDSSPRRNGSALAVERNHNAAERDKLAAAKLKEHKLEVLQGRYIPRAVLDVELSSRAVVLDSGLKTWFQSHVSELVLLVNGDISRATDMIKAFSLALDQQMNRYSKAIEWEVDFDFEAKD